MNRYILLYLFLCLFETAVFMWLEVPSVGFIEAELGIDGVVDGSLAWVVFVLAFIYAVAAILPNTRILYKVQERTASPRSLVMLATGWVIFPGSLGVLLYFLTGDSYVALPFDGLMLVLTPYYYRHLRRLLSNPALDQIVT